MNKKSAALDHIDYMQIRRLILYGDGFGAVALLDRVYNAALTPAPDGVVMNRGDLEKCIKMLIDAGKAINHQHFHTGFASLEWIATTLEAALGENK